MNRRGRPQQQGLYDPRFEHDACGIGFVVDMKGRVSHEFVEMGIQMLLNLNHRGACGCEENTGDGAGILLQTPHRFFEGVCADAGIRLPAQGGYGVGMIFLPDPSEARRECERLLDEVVREEGQEVLGWRTVPVDNSLLGPTAKACQPVIRQIFIGARGAVPGQDLERKLYVIRRRVENLVRASDIRRKEMFYVASLSSRTVVYKGMLRADQMTSFYPDLVEPSLETGLAMVHSRFSTNTFPNWSRAHPNRYLCHNGEINTLQGNCNWMRAREALFESDLLGPDLDKVLPVIDPDGSDSAMFDNALEMLYMTGRSLPHSMMMMIPEPWSGDPDMNPAKRAFYEYHSCLMEPWDGPASIAFTDGLRAGAVLDRNGLRPSRYSVTTDGQVILASEVGVLDVPPQKVLRKGRLQPGRMFLVDAVQGRIISDGELKRKAAVARPYRKWLREHLTPLDLLPGGGRPPALGRDGLRRQQHLFGYTNEDLRLLIAPMASEGHEAMGSMGTDTPLALLSDRPQLLYNYFKQLFAQVTNPPVDAIREALIMSLDTHLGSEGNLLDPRPQSAQQIRLSSPILDGVQMEKLRRLDGSGPGGFRTTVLPAFLKVEEEDLEQALDRLCQEGAAAVSSGSDLLVLSDRDPGRAEAPIPALLAVSGVHHHLIREGLRTRASLVVESGEPREVHHFSLLIGYGAGAVHPYLALETIRGMIRDGIVPDRSYEKCRKNYVKAVNKGVVKVMSKMGISTVQSYRGAQIFEAVGLASDVVDRYFTGTPSRVGGVGMEVLETEVRHLHERAWIGEEQSDGPLESGGQYQWRRTGEHHLFNPQTVHRLQYACRTGDEGAYRDYSRRVNDQTRRLCTLRGLFRLKHSEEPIPIQEVEPVEEIMRRFKTGAMSYGSISLEAHESLAIAMNRIGGKSNTGEGGEDPKRYTADPNGDSRNSAIKQVASGRFGVTSEYLVNSRELQIKMAQGAKPGEGGQLPGHKVYPWIAKVRYSTPGVGLISPPPHHDIYSIEDLAALIHDLKNANHEARISVKLVAEVGVGTIAAGVSKGRADVVLISGHDGGTGASPLTSIKHAGIPWELGLAETHQVLLLNDLRSRIVVEVDGQLKTGRDVVVAALLGGEEFGFATAPLVVLGCVMMRVCHLNTCPVGVATQDPELRKKFTGDPAHVVNFMRFVAQEARELMASLGFRSIDEMIGRSDKLGVRDAVDHWKTRGLDFSRILYRPEMPSSVGRFCQIPQDHKLDAALDRTRLLELCRPALERGQPVAESLPIGNVNRTVGTMVGSEVTRRYGRKGLPEDTIQLRFRGSAGQSFGAFIPRGMTLSLEGDANDYIGKGLSGGKIIVRPPRESVFVAQENVIVGNVAFYGATSGEAYIRGLAGERFCVRNSGVRAVVEGVGDHGCEYMTGGCVVVLGPTGRNFAAGMSGGIAYVLDESGEFSSVCNPEMVELLPLDDAEDGEILARMVRRHVELTGSEIGWQLLSSGTGMAARFVKVYPVDYRRVVETQDRMKDQGLSDSEVVMAAFQVNARNKARADGR